jgi:hypothetical protein
MRPARAPKPAALWPPRESHHARAHSAQLCNHGLSLALALHLRLRSGARRRLQSRHLLQLAAQLGETPQLRLGRGTLGMVSDLRKGNQNNHSTSEGREQVQFDSKIQVF